MRKLMLLLLVICFASDARPSEVIYSDWPIKVTDMTEAVGAMSDKNLAKYAEYKKKILFAIVPQVKQLIFDQWLEMDLVLRPDPIHYAELSFRIEEQQGNLLLKGWLGSRYGHGWVVESSFQLASPRDKVSTKMLGFKPWGDATKFPLKPLDSNAAQIWIRLPTWIRLELLKKAATITAITGEQLRLSSGWQRKGDAERFVLALGSGGERHRATIQAVSRSDIEAISVPESPKPYSSSYEDKTNELHHKISKVLSKLELGALNRVSKSPSLECEALLVDNRPFETWRGLRRYEDWLKTYPGSPYHY